MSGADLAFIIAIAGAAFSFYYFPQIGFAACRVRQLNECADLLRAHNAAVHAFIERTDVPDDLKHLLLDFSDAMDDDEAVRGVAKSMLAGNGGRSSPRAEALNVAIRSAFAQSPEGLRVMADAVTAGFFAAFLRVPDTAKNFDLLVVAIATRGSERTIGFAEEAPRMMSAAPGDLIAA